MQRVPQEAPQLHDDRIVEAERPAQALAVGDADILPDHLVDRIADVAKQYESDQRDDDEDKDGPGKRA